MTEINLFPKTLKKIRQRQHWKRLSFRSLLALLTTLSMAMIGLSIYNLMLTRTNQQLGERIDISKGKILELQEIESKQVYLISKLDAFKRLLTTHERHQAITETIFALLPDGTTLKNFKVAEEGSILLSGSVPDFLTLEELLSRVRNSGGYRLPILKATMQQVSYGVDGSLNFNLMVELGKGS